MREVKRALVPKYVTPHRIRLPKVSPDLFFFVFPSFSSRLSKGASDIICTFYAQDSDGGLGGGTGCCCKRTWKSRRRSWPSPQGYCLRIEADSVAPREIRTSVSGWMKEEGWLSRGSAAKKNGKFMKNTNNHGVSRVPPVDGFITSGAFGHRCDISDPIDGFT